MVVRIGELMEEGAAALRAAGIENARNEARWLLEHVLGDRCKPFDEREAGAGAARQYRRMITRRARRVPLQYLLKTVEFAGVELTVSPAVLIPRPETEELVGLAAAWLEQHAWARRVADVGTGSGCIAIVLAKAAPRIECWASDVSRAALRIARANARRNGVADRVRCTCGSWFAGWSEELTFDMIVTNPPYVERGAQLEPELAYEPAEALYAGEDGLEAYRSMLPEVRRRLNPGGIFLGEMGVGQAEALRNLARASGLGEVRILKDARGRERFVRWEKGD